MAAPPSKPAHLDPSELGTKQYWDDLYARELTSHATNPADEGTVWFDDSDAEAKMLGLLATLPGLAPGSAALLDLGSGNGSLLLAARAAGWRGPLLGVDYSADSVALARRVATARSAAAAEDDATAAAAVRFESWDVLAGPLRDVGSPAAWDAVLDKGTFDAVSLAGETDAAGRRVCEGYRTRVLALLREGGYFVVTSCNWTEEELRGWFEGSREGDEGGRLELASRVEYPSFSFGGVKGTTISTLSFRKTS